MGAALKRLDGVLDGGVGRNEEDERFRAEVMQPFEELQAVDAGKLHIAQGRVETALLGPGQRFLAAVAGDHLAAFLCQELGQRVADDRLVVHDEKMTG